MGKCDGASLTTSPVPLPLNRDLALLISYNPQDNSLRESLFTGLLFLYLPRFIGEETGGGN